MKPFLITIFASLLFVSNVFANESKVIVVTENKVDASKQLRELSVDSGFGLNWSIVHQSTGCYSSATIDIDDVKAEIKEALTMAANDFNSSKDRDVDINIISVLGTAGQLTVTMKYVYDAVNSENSYEAEIKLTSCKSQ